MKKKTYRFDPVDLQQMRLLGALAPEKRIRIMLDARELAVGFDPWPERAEDG